MRKATAIFFLGLFLLYHIGYLGYYWYSSQQINEQWLTHVEVTPDMKRVSIPITLPYWNDQTTYRVTHGKITIDGKVYQKVMQKYAKDAIHLILAEDRQTEVLQQNIADWVRAMSDSETPLTGKADLLKVAAKDYTLPQYAKSASYYQSIEEPAFGELITSRPSVAFGEVGTPPPQA